MDGVGGRVQTCDGRVRGCGMRMRSRPTVKQKNGCPLRIGRETGALATVARARYLRHPHTLGRYRRYGAVRYGAACFGWCCEQKEHYTYCTLL